MHFISPSAILIYSLSDMACHEDLPWHTSTWARHPVLDSRIQGGKVRLNMQGGEGSGISVRAEIVRSSRVNSGRLAGWPMVRVAIRSRAAPWGDLWSESQPRISKKIQADGLPRPSRWLLASIIVMPAKRPWDEANQPEDAAWERSSSRHARTPTSMGRENKTSSQTATQSFLQAIPQISRKVKACATCRKHKVSGCLVSAGRNWPILKRQIKCIMEDSGPPCKRCVEKKLGCTLNKSLQTLISERTE